MAFNVSLFFKGTKKWINRAGAKVYPEILSKIRDDLISMHGTAAQKLKDHEVEESPHEFRLNLPQFTLLHFWIPHVVLLNSFAVAPVYNMS